MVDDTVSIVFKNRATEEGRELGAQIARFADQEAERTGRDGRCSTCAFRSGEHLANGSPATLMSAIKCMMENEPFWCHQHDRHCSGWRLLRFADGEEVTAPWEHISGFDDPNSPHTPKEPDHDR